MQWSQMYMQMRFLYCKAVASAGFHSGHNICILLNQTFNCLAVLFRDNNKPINILTGIDYWLDNLMCNVPELVMCFHVNGIVQVNYSHYWLMFICHSKLLLHRQNHGIVAYDIPASIWMGVYQAKKAFKMVFTTEKFALWICKHNPIFAFLSFVF